jgi:hypothetical protein
MQRDKSKLVFYLFLFTVLLSCNADKNEQLVSNHREVTAVEETISYDLFFHFDNDIPSETHNKLKVWIDSIYNVTQETLGNYPFDVHMYVHSSNSNQAVSFGHTTRKEHHEVHFYVNPKAALNEFMEDWIAPHEISHLAIPFVGKKTKWFAEGFATFLSRQVMIQLDLVTENEVDSLYKSKMADAKNAYEDKSLSFAEKSMELFERHKYGSVYWGSASYFYRIDQKLQVEKGIRFVDVLKDYQNCCRLNDSYLIDVIKSFDSISESNYFTDLMLAYRTKPASQMLEMF